MHRMKLPQPLLIHIPASQAPGPTHPTLTSHGGYFPSCWPGPQFLLQSCLPLQGVILRPGM